MANVSPYRYGEGCAACVDGQEWSTPGGEGIRLCTEHGQIVDGTPGWTKGPSDSSDHGEHNYLSTACFHGLHEQCRATCKYCLTRCACSLCDHSIVPMGESYQVGERVEFQEPRTDLWVDATVVGHDEFGRPRVKVPRYAEPFAPDPSKLRRIHHHAQ